MMEFVDKHRNVLKYLWYLIPIGQIILVALFYAKNASMGVIPGKYIILMVLFFFLFNGLVLFVKQNMSKIPLIVVSIISVVMSCVLIYGLVALGKVSAAVDKVVTNEDAEITQVSILVRADSTVSGTDELSGMKIGLMDSNPVKRVAVSVNNDLNAYPSYALYSHFVYLIDALLDGTEDAVIIEDAFIDILSDSEEPSPVSDRIRVLKTYDIPEESSEPVVRISRVVENKSEPVGSGDKDNQDDSLAENNSENESGEEQKDSETGGEKNNQTPSVPKKDVVNTGGIPNSANGAKTSKLDWSNDILSAPEGCFIAYISGIDALGTVNTKRRSDVNILAVVNTNTGTMQLISTPRDYYVILPNVGKADKLTHAGLFGVGNSIAALEKLYGIKVDYYLRMNFTGFVKIIDTLGGIDVWSDYEFTVEPVKTYSVGMNHLNGVEALAFARERYSFSSGDIQRSINQMAVIKSMIAKICSPDILYNYAPILDSISDCIQTSMPADVIYAFVNKQLASGIPWNVGSYTTVGYGASAKTYTSPEEDRYVMSPNDDNVFLAHELIRGVLQ